MRNRIYLDCDGVLADFDMGFKQEFEIDPSVYETAHGSAAFWKNIRNCNGFFEHLPLMPDAKELFHAVEHLRPIILTGCPFGGWAENQKMRWRDKHFPGVPMVTCMSKNKYQYCKTGDVLIDDMEKARAAWNAAGGHFILHTSASNSIGQFEEINDTYSLNW